MAFLARALLLLCGLQGTVLSLRGHCTDTQCYALFVGQKDFRGAQKSCRNSDGDLLLFLDAEAQGHLLAGLSGSYWFGTAGGAPNCTSCTVWMGGNLTIEKRPCGDKLAGYICQYPNADPCGAIHPVAEDAKVTYAAPMSFEVNATSLHFPRGTVAVEAETGAFHPLAKYLCFESSWLKAPWNCEVMGGGCEERCNSTTSSCECSERTVLHANLITCSENPCDRCAHLCDAATQKCACRAGYALGPDGKNCADVDECEQPDVCTSEGKECVNTRGGYECRCKDGFEEEKEEGGEGACVDVSICDKCEHMKCDKSDGVYACACREGFRVSPLDPTKCEMSCDRQDCLANCIPNPDLEEKDMHQCFCPDGYIQDIRNNTAYCTDIDECKNRKQCEHTCENLFGSFACSCNEGYDLFDEYMCVPPDGEGWRPADPTPAPPRAASMPTYVKAGSVLGITVFLLLCLLLLYLLVRNLAKRCGSLELSSLKGPDVDIFYGGFVCSCRKGFTLVDEVFCDRNEDEDEEAVGSGEAATTPSAPTVTPHEVAPTRQPSAVTVGGLVAIIVCCVLVVVVVVFLSQHILFSGILSVHVQQHCGARQLECLILAQFKRLQNFFFGGNFIKWCTLGQNVSIPLNHSVQVLDLHDSSLQLIWAEGTCLDVFNHLENLLGLNLSFNSLKSLPQGIFGGLRSVVEIDLSSNALTHLRPNVFPDGLRNLRLSNNFLAYPDPSAFDSLFLLSLSGNRFYCDCHLESFLKWMNATNVTLIGPEDYRCELPVVRYDLPLLNYSRIVEPCEVDDELAVRELQFALFVSSTLLIVTVTLCGIAYARLRGRIYILYKKVVGRVLEGPEAPPPLREAQYDVYLCFSNTDYVWVEAALLKKLDNEFSEENILRCCFEARDFLPGQDHLSNIRDAIWSSRKTVCVVSKEFLRDGWCLEAFTLAQGRMLNELRNVLIVLVVGKVAHYQLMKYNAVRAFVQRREYLSWPEDPQDLEWFYERLVSKILKDAEVKTLDKGVPKPDIPPGNDIQLENIEAQQ